MALVLESLAVATPGLTGLDPLPFERALVRVSWVVIALRVLMAVRYPFSAASDDLGPDGITHLRIAHALLFEGYPWPSIFSSLSTPLYVLLLSVLILLPAPYFLVGRIACLALWLVVLWLSHRMLGRVFGRTSAWVAVATLSLDDPYRFIKYLQYELLFMALVVAATKVFIEAMEGTGQRAWPLFVSGLLLGLATLTQGKALPIPLALVLGWLTVVRWVGPRQDGAASSDRRPRREAAMALGWMTFGMALVCLPWALRNLQVTGRFQVTGANGGLTFYLGNNPFATGTLNYPPDEAWPVSRSMPLEEADPHLYRAGLEFIRRRPLEVVTRLVPLKLYWLFELWRPRNVLLLGLFAAGMMLALARGPTPAMGALLGLFAYVVLVHAIYYGWGRHRFPALPAMHGFSALIIGEIARRVAGERARGI